MPARKVRIIGVPLDLGQSRRGVDMGPSAIRAAGLSSRLRQLGHEVRDDGDIAVGIPENRTVGDEKARYAGEIAKVCERLSKRVEAILQQAWTPLILGGDHSLAIGALAGCARGPGSLGLLWLDAHADINTPATSASGNVHGMPLAFCFGLAGGRLAKVVGNAPVMNPQNAVIVGLRDVDPGERANLALSGIHWLTMRHIDERGMRGVMEQALGWASQGVTGIHVSLDMDVIDPRDAPGVGTPRRGGLTYREAHLAMEMIADSGVLRSMDIVEVNPILDQENRTADLAVELALSAFGQRIA
jgi:arginase